ncbi:hypothetical protein [Planococcus sp. ISL-110]|uniref:hypothetical protein n=1 Tax=Planococcus sp. ISL-110 TaxID=2819167 RepID=UPI001BE6DF82|nr:hypothetical protein [Planococcus sp. ISL-110]MBT2571705.1 hypothetical protein [Planococcus sp. ISL-110]
MIKSAVIQNIDLFPRWQEILAVALGLADEFSVVYPNGEYDTENFLLNGKPEFVSLPNLKVGRWPNMTDSSIFLAVWMIPYES